MYTLTGRGRIFELKIQKTGELVKTGSFRACIDFAIKNGNANINWVHKNIDSTDRRRTKEITYEKG